MLTGKLPYLPGVQNLKGSSWIASSAPLALARITEPLKYCFSRELDTEQNKEGVSLAQCSDTKTSFTKFSIKEEQQQRHP